MFNGDKGAEKVVTQFSKYSLDASVLIQKWVALAKNEALQTRKHGY